jgi:AcrR family transcriptional regulator
VSRKPLAERRAQLIDAALRVAAQAGVEAVTVRAVAQEAGVSLGTVHYCFQDKDELLDAMGHSIAVRASEQISDAVRQGAEAGLDFRTLVHLCADALLEGLKRWRSTRLLLLEIAITGARNPALHPTALAHVEASVVLVRKIVVGVARATGVVYRIDADVLSRVVSAMNDGIELSWLVDGDDEAALQAFHAMAEMVISYAVNPDGPPVPWDGAEEDDAEDRFAPAAGAADGSAADDAADTAADAEGGSARVGEGEGGRHGDVDGDVDGDGAGAYGAGRGRPSTESV